MDVSGAVKAVARLPLAPEALLEQLVASEAQAANQAGDCDHTVFWLTVADQFAKRGIDCAAARERALAIIDQGADLTAMAALGMDEKSLKKRAVMLAALRERIAAPIPAGKPRKVLKAPQSLLLDVGEVVTYPLCQGAPINPYTVGKTWAWVVAWKQDGWGAAIIADRGLAFGYLAWYAPMVLAEPLAEEPDLASLAGKGPWIASRPGTLTARHFANMQLKSLGRVSLDPDRLAHFAPPASGVASAINDISLCDGLGVTRAARRTGLPRSVRALSDVVADPARTASGRPLTGRWRGEYRYRGDRRPPGAFAAEIEEADGAVGGEIRETGSEGTARMAGVEGRRLDWLVRFRRHYEGRGPVDYVGEIDDAGAAIAGQWSIAGNGSGTFTMSRED
jgi:hypothetical protein